MRKIPTLFVRDPADRAHVLPVVTPGCEWVARGEGVATRKYDGTCVRLTDDGRWQARREVKPGKVAPAGFEAEETDPITGKTVGWEPVEQSGFARWHAEALTDEGWANCPPGTYELIGPKINGNPEHVPNHALIRHGAADLLPAIDLLVQADVHGFYEVMSDELTDFPYEGIVWHHPDGRMVKLKGRDFRDQKVVGNRG